MNRNICSMRGAGYSKTVRSGPGRSATAQFGARAAVILFKTVLAGTLAAVLGCSDTPTYQINRARGLNLESAALAEKSEQANSRLEQINLELAAKVESLRAASGRTETAAARCESEASKAELRVAKRASGKKKPALSKVEGASAAAKESSKSDAAAAGQPHEAAAKDGGVNAELPAPKK